MPQQLFHVELGVNLDDLVHILPSNGAPGGDADVQDAAGVGSLSLDYTNGAIYQKITAGVGTDKWAATSNVLTLSWRDPVITVDTVTRATVGAVETALNLQPTNGSYTPTTTSGTYDNVTYPFVVGTGAVDETITVTFSDATNFSVTGSVTGAIGSGDVGSDFVSDQVTILSAGWGGTWAAAETLTAAITAGGVIGDLVADNFADGDRILLTDLTTGTENVYIVTGTPGSGATLVEDANTPTDGDMLWSSSGDTQWAFTGTDWVQIGATSANELGYIRSFIGKDGLGAETPDYGGGVTTIGQYDDLETAIGKLDTAIDGIDLTEDGFIRSFIGKDAVGAETPDYGSAVTTVGQTDDLETAVGKLDARLEELGAEAADPSVTTQEPLDEVLVDEYDVVRWIVHAKDDTGNVMVWEVIATHNGTTGADATDVDYSVYGKQRMGSIPGAKVSVALNGLTGAAQEMELLVESNSAVAFKSTRVSF